MRTEEMIEAVRQRLEQRLRELGAELAPDLSADADARALRARLEDLNAGKAGTRCHGNTLRGELDALHLGEALYLEAALHRLAVGPFAECIDCHQKIDQARLLVNPATERCKACQQDWEAAGSHAADPLS